MSKFSFKQLGQQQFNIYHAIWYIEKKLTFPMNIRLVFVGLEIDLDDNWYYTMRDQLAHGKEGGGGGGGGGQGEHLSCVLCAAGGFCNYCNFQIWIEVACLLVYKPRPQRS